MRAIAHWSMVLVVSAGLGVLLVPAPADAGLVTERYEFAEPAVELIDGYHRVSMEGALGFGNPGEPVLPMVGARLLLPPGETISGLRIIPGEKVTLGDGFTVEPGQPQQPLSFVGPVHRVAPNYDDMTAFPGRTHDEPVLGTFRGYTIATLALHPVQYDPSSGTLSYYSSLDVEVTTETDGDLLEVTERAIRHDEKTLAGVSRMIDNPSEVFAYSGIERVRNGSRALDPSLGYTYLIITTDSWDDYLGDLVAFETKRGHKTGMFLNTWITSNYSGVDEQEQIRNFIIDAYGTWDVDYVLLVGDAGDANGIPDRGLFASAYGDTDEHIPADLYYAALDGTWNDDADGRWGESGEEDFYPEVGIGRACVSTSSDVVNFVTKTTRYVESPIVSECDEALMAGELLWESPLTYGGDYKDQVKDGSSLGGYTTVGFPGTMNVGTLYDKDGTWGKSTLINLMENGMNIVNHLGHCNNTYAMKMVISDIASFDNDGTNHSLNFVYSQGCYSGAFDNRDPYGSYVGDCFAEEFACDDDGAVAIVMNSRYGWGDPGGTNGSSQYYDREFFDAMFAESLYPIGDVNNDSKVDVLWAISYGANKWCYYQLNVFGDPAMHLWTSEPDTLTAVYPSSVLVGQPTMDVTVTEPGVGPIEGARVTIYTSGYAVYDTDVTNASGVATLDVNASAPGPLYIKVTAHDFRDYDAETTIAPAAGPYVVLDSHIVDDDGVGESDGNDDGIVNAGETIELVATLGNVGTEEAFAVGATISLVSPPPGTVISDDYEEYGDIPADSLATCLDDYEFSVDGGTPDGTLLQFLFSIQDSTRGLWESYLNLEVAAPVLDYASHVADDSPGGGNGNGCLEAGETITLAVSLANSGGASATSVVATLSSDDPNVVIHESTASVSSIAPEATEALSPSYSVSLLPDCPSNYEILFTLDVTGDRDYEATPSFTILTGGGDFADDVESGEGDWTHSVVTGGFADDWHIETYRSHSSSHSWKFGGSGSGNYSDSSDGGLVTRALCIGGNAELTFWSWLYAEQESSTSAWDCCLVEITTDGGANWDVVTPNGGYSHLKNDNPANPLPTGTPCWSGYHDWRLETFDLSSYEGETIQVRFRFASDGYVTEEGWYVDDIQLVGDGWSTSVGDDQLLPADFALRQNAPNPFNPVTAIQYELPQDSHVRISVYNVAGKLVKAMVDEHQQAGVKTVIWDGTNDVGQKVASGIYVYRMEAEDHVSSKRMVLLK